MDNSQIFQVVIGQVLRHFLTGAAALLTAYGVTTAEQNTLVETVIVIALSVGMALAAQVWSYISKYIAVNQYPPDK